MALTFTNLVATPTFESDSVGGWTTTAGTLSVSTDKSAFGTRCLKLTSSASGSHVVMAPAIAVSADDLFKSTSIAVRLASSAASASVSIGARYYNSSDVQIGQVVSSKSVNPTLARHTHGMTFSGVATVSLRPVISWTASAAGQSIYIDTVTYLRHSTDNYAQYPWGSVPAMPDVIGSLADWGNVSFDWVGTPEASLSTATCSAVATIDTTAVRGEVVTISGTSFPPSTDVALRVSNSALGSGRISINGAIATVTTDGAGAFSYDWTVDGDQGQRWIAAQTDLAATGFGDVSDMVTIQPGPAGPPDINYAINPRMSVANGTGRFVFNRCPNPSPTVDLTGWEAVGAATVTRSTAAKIVGISHGARVVSATSGDGIALPWADGNWLHFGETVYVRAVTDCTLTIGMEGVNTPNLRVEASGWGDTGWGDETYVDGATKALTAGQIIRARLSAYGGSGTIDPYKIRMKLTGSGTYDVDGVWQGMGVEDGESGGPGSVPYFDGDTLDDDDFTYEWTGTPNASTSARRGTLAMGIDSAEDFIPDPLSYVGDQAYNHGHLTTLDTGETALALRSQQWFSNAIPRLTNAAGGSTLNDLGLEDEKSYFFSVDVVMDYSTLYGGYAIDGSNGNSLYLYAGGSADSPYITPYPGRTRLHIPFVVPTSPASNDDYVGFGISELGWLLGEVKFTNLSITETKIYSMETEPTDLSDSGIETGSTVLVSCAIGGTDVETTIAFQALVDGVWATVNSMVIPAEVWEGSQQFTATVPLSATGMRLVTTGSTDAIDSYVVSDAPPPFFDGDTADGDGYTYSWAGTAGVSASIRTEAAVEDEIRVFDDGVLKEITEMRAFRNGALLTITEAGLP